MQHQAQRIVVCGAGFIGFHIAKALVSATVYDVPRAVQLASRHSFKLYRQYEDLRSQMPAGTLLPAVAVDITRPDTLKAAFEGANVIVSLVGVMYGSTKTIEDVQWRGAENIAKAAKVQGAKVIHFSAIGANENSEIVYYRTKGLGEKTIRCECKDATIIRPSLVFGPGDSFFSRFATLSKILPFLPVFDGGKTRFQPVYVGDVARVVEIAARLSDKNAMEATNGKVIEAGGPDILTYREVMESVLKHTGRKRPIISLPYSVGRMQGLIFEQLPPNVFTLTREQVEQLKYDNVVDKSPAPDRADFADLLHRFNGQPLRSIDEILPTYL